MNSPGITLAMVFDLAGSFRMRIKELDVRDPLLQYAIALGDRNVLCMVDIQLTPVPSQGTVKQAQPRAPYYSLSEFDIGATHRPSTAWVSASHSGLKAWQDEHMPEWKFTAQMWDEPPMVLSHEVAVSSIGRSWSCPWSCPWSWS